MTEKGSLNRHNHKSFSEVSEDKTADSTPNKIKQSCEPKKLIIDSQVIKLKSYHTLNSMQNHQNMTMKNDDLELTMKSELQKSRMSHKPIVKIHNIERQSSPSDHQLNKYEENNFSCSFCIVRYECHECSGAV